MPPTPAIQLVVFDLGRVLLRIADDWAHAYALADLPHPSNQHGDISSARQRRHDPQAERLFADFETGRIPPEQFFAFTARANQIEPDHARRALEAWLIEPFPGVGELLDRLAHAPVKTACLSNTNAHHWISLTDPSHPAYLPLDRLDFRFASQQVGHAKPSPRIYQHVEETTGTDAAAILFFDDLPENVAAARDRGWHAELVERCDNPLPRITQQLMSYGVL